jgi:hypothetical protein
MFLPMVWEIDAADLNDPGHPATWGRAVPARPCLDAEWGVDLDLPSGLMVWWMAAPMAWGE